MERILRIAQDDGGGKWTPGTVLGVHPEDFKPNWGDEAAFLLIKVHNLTVVMQSNIEKRKVRIVLDRFMSLESQDKYVRNKLKYYDPCLRGQPTHGREASETAYEGLYKSFGKRPDFSKSVDMSMPELFVSAPSTQWAINPADTQLPKGKR